MGKSNDNIETRPEDIVPAEDAVPTEAAKPEQKKATAKPAEETIFIPKAGRKENNFVIITVNGKSYKIMRGVKVKVPKAVAEVYRHSLKASDDADDYISAALGDGE